MKPEQIKYEDLEAAFPEMIKCGIEVNTGWYSLIWDMCENLVTSRNAQKMSTFIQDPLQLVTIKEKFGTLRVYSIGATDEDLRIISMFEDMSQFICQSCGDAGSLRGRHWLYVACDEHTNPSDK